MKYKNGKELVGKHINGNPCIIIYKVISGVVYTLWEFALACFSRGWNNDKGWSNDVGWSND